MTWLLFASLFMAALPLVHAIAPPFVPAGPGLGKRRFVTFYHHRGYRVGDCIVSTTGGLLIGNRALRCEPVAPYSDGWCYGPPLVQILWCYRRLPHISIGRFGYRDCFNPRLVERTWA